MMYQTTIQCLHDNLRVFEHLAEEVEMRAANMPENQQRARVMGRLAEIHEHVAQLKDQIAIREGESETQWTSDRQHRVHPVRRSFIKLWSEIIQEGQ